MVHQVGCASHSYTITDRDGRFITSSGVLTAVEYNRILNDTSTASATIAVTGPDCCEQLGGIRSWRHILSIYRNNEFIWSGFILNVDWTTESVRVGAVDLIGLLDRRVPHQNFTFTGTDLAVIAETLIEDAFAPDDPGHEVTVVAPAGVTGGRQYAQNIGQSADHLRDLADTGIDFTVIGNNIVILPDGFCEVIGRLSDDDMPEGLSVAEDGASLATRQVVAGSDESGVVGTAGGWNEYYGLLELYDEQTSITTTADADIAARAKLASSAVVPVHIDTQNVTLASTAPVDIVRLVPGWCLDITSDSTCRTITQRLKITGLQISEDGGSGDDPGQERILVQVAATGNELETRSIDAQAPPVPPEEGA